MIYPLDKRGTLQARAHQRAHREPLRRLARGVAVAIGITLCFIPETASNGSIRPIQSLKQLADYHLPDNQFKCHNEIVFRESTWRANARNGPHYGYYQIRNALLKDAPNDYQFIFYWKYVSHRYGLDSYNDEVPTGGCGFFECINDQAAAIALFDQAKNWLIEHGMKAMMGPINFGETDMWWGLLVDGFSNPYYGMNYNPSYYQQFFVEYGFNVKYEQISNKIDVVKGMPEKVFKIAKWVEKKNGYIFKPLDPKHISKFAADFKEIYNDAWKDFENFTQVTDATIIETLEKIKPVMDPNLIWFSYTASGEPVAFVMILPDTNELIKGLNGKLDLIGKLKFLWNKFTVKHKKMRAVIMGTKESYRNQGLESCMFMKLQEYVQPLGHYEELELSWVGDFNSKMLALHQAVGATYAKKHTTYILKF